MSRSFLESAKSAELSFRYNIIGATIGIAIASSIFGNRLVEGLKEFAPDAPFEVRNNVEASSAFYLLIRSFRHSSSSCLLGAIQLIKTLSAEIQVGVKHAYVLALNRVYVITVAAGKLLLLSISRMNRMLTTERRTGGLASISALLIRNISIKGKTVMAGGA